MAVHLESGDDVVIIEGTAVMVADELLLTRFADACEAKYSFRPDVKAGVSGVFRVPPTKVFAWRERDFPESATRWDFGGE